MKIAIAAESKSLESEISMKAGRAPYYLIFENGILKESINNPFAKGGGGAGYSMAYLLARKKVGLVVAGRIGDNMKFALKEKGIIFKEISGKIGEVIQKIN